MLPPQMVNWPENFDNIVKQKIRKLPLKNNSCAFDQNVTTNSYFRYPLYQKKKKPITLNTFCSNCGVRT